MKPGARVFVAGHGGLVGSAIVRRLRAAGHHDLLLRTRAELDLRSKGAVERFFAATRPAHVFLAAARVGGILANDTLPAEFILDNLLIQTHVIEAARQHGVEKLLFLGSSCVYPKHAPQPIREESLLGGPLEPTNRAYAVAKIAGIEMLDAYRRQYGTRGVTVMPSNVYGPNDNFDPAESHVISGLIRRFHEAKAAGATSVTLWGTGTVRREFLHADDLAEACLLVMDAYEGPAPINVGPGEDLTVRELAEMVRDVVGFDGEIRLDPTKPDGTPRKLLEVSRIHALGWRARTPLREGLAATYAWFLEHVAGSAPGGR